MSPFSWRSTINCFQTIRNEKRAMRQKPYRNMTKSSTIQILLMKKQLKNIRILKSEWNISQRDEKKNSSQSLRSFYRILKKSNQGRNRTKKQRQIFHEQSNPVCIEQQRRTYGIYKWCDHPTWQYKLWKKYTPICSHTKSMQIQRKRTWSTSECHDLFISNQLYRK